MLSNLNSLLPFLFTQPVIGPRSRFSAIHRLFHSHSPSFLDDRRTRLQLHPGDRDAVLLVGLWSLGSSLDYPFPDPGPGTIWNFQLGHPTAPTVDVHQGASAEGGSRSALTFELAGAPLSLPCVWRYVCVCLCVPVVQGPAIHFVLLSTCWFRPPPGFIISSIRST